ncbi:GNAT family N-acetyltransferase [Virgibacillus siamensis]|uniref:GNAT family N-acetyltransferase n=1 Tax=Virgibacillus siamensis TaxID=480071 RepID=UPI0009853A19|nr:GNAT family N-acetyltransferase [Virgibacillus siamensis]
METLRETPWDKRNFNINTYEVLDYSETTLQKTDNLEGHFTLKVNPLESPELLLKHGFYYMDTLIEPVCQRENLNIFYKEGTSISKDYDPDEILQIANEAFMHGRFHRDFHIPDNLADLRYANWVNDLIKNDSIFALKDHGRTVGFYAYDQDKVLLLGITQEYRKKGLAKTFTSQGCQKQFTFGYDQLRTSISAANVASLNLFQALGFKLSKTIDVYHKMNGPGV